MALAQSGNDTGKEVGIALLARSYEPHATAVERILPQIGDDANWEVRESAAMALGTILANAFDQITPRMRAWAGDERANVRRMVVVGIWAAARACSDEQCGVLLGILDPLLGDSDPYVRRNLGPFAIGDALLRCHPRLVSAWLRERLASEEMWVRWNLAMALTSAEAARHVALASDLLSALATDERPIVARAVQRAALNLARRIPDHMLPLLEAWIRDPARSPVAQAVLAKLRAYSGK